MNSEDLSKGLLLSITLSDLPKPLKSKGLTGALEPKNQVLVFVLVSESGSDRMPNFLSLT